MKEIRFYRYHKYYVYHELVCEPQFWQNTLNLKPFIPFIVVSKSNAITITFRIFFMIKVLFTIYSSIYVFIRNIDAKQSKNQYVNKLESMNTEKENQKPNTTKKAKRKKNFCDCVISYCTTVSVFFLLALKKCRFPILSFPSLFEQLNHLGSNHLSSVQTINSPHKIP